MQAAFEAAFAVLTALGGGAFIVFSFSSWLGKVWANRIFEQERVKYSNQIEEIKKRLELQLHSGKILFDAEFDIYRELWAHANALRVVAINIRSGFKKSSLTEDESVERYKLFREQIIQLEDFADSNKPFFSAEIHSALYLLIQHARFENECALQQRSLDGMDLAKARADCVIPIIIASEELSSAIRNRLFETRNLQ